MKQSQFEAALRADGFDPPVLRERAAGEHTPEHLHDYEVRGLVLAGEFRISIDGAERAYRSGEMFIVAPDIRHAETVGPDGATYVFGKRR